MAEKTVLPGMQLPAPHPCCMPQLSADDQSAITRTFLKAHPACSQHVAVLLPEYLRFIKLKLEQPPGVFWPLATSSMLCGTVAHLTFFLSALRLRANGLLTQLLFPPPFVQRTS